MIALYQEWLPFLLAIGYVLIHHGVVGTLWPTAVYNHPDAWAHPWRWAAIHAGFVLAACVASLINWRLHEAQALALGVGKASLGEAQRIAHLGSWEYDHVTRQLTWSDEVFRIAGYSPQSFTPTPERLMRIIHPDDRERVRRALKAALARGAPYDVDHRVLRPDGEVRLVHQQAELARAAAGRRLRWVGIVQDVTERRALEERLQHQATHDALTGLPNRALFADRLERALARSRRDARPCAVFFLDLDRFKQVNDTLGHAAGDELLVAVVARLHACLRDTDTLARFGGDEFVLLVEDPGGPAGALRVAERLLVALTPAYPLAGRTLSVTTSIGVALSTGPEDTPEDLLRFADVALYRAKEAGRGGCEIFYPGMDGTAQARLELEHDLRNALARREFSVYYQPKVDLASGRVTALEALVRWHHPTRGLVSPGDFIPIAEETGLIRPLGRWVLHEACCQIVAWMAAHPGQHAPRIAVNLSARQFRDPDLAADVASILDASGLAPDLLILEVTETAAMEHVEAAIQALTALRALGIRLALDDFGTGHASLAYLQRLPLDTLKIDRAFFQDTPQNRAIVGAVTALAHGLGLDVTAEGLETAEQVAWAQAAGCDRGQGFYFACALPPEEIAALWAAGLSFTLPPAGASVAPHLATFAHAAPTDAQHGLS